MSLFSGKKFLLLGFIVVLLIAIPITIYLVQQQQKTRSAATPATILTLTPATNTVPVGENVTLAFNVNPGGTNQVSFVKFKITYDATKLATAEGGFEVKSWTASDGTNFTPTILKQPVYEDGSITGEISVGSNVQYAITLPTQIAAITFEAIGSTEGAPTTVGFDITGTQVLSVGGESSASENVLSTTSPATISTTGEAPTDTPTPTPTAAPTPTTTPAEGDVPVCSSLTLSSASNSAIPLSVTLTANGTDSDGTINKVTFNFGDGTTQDVTEAGGIGSDSVSVEVSHIYNSAGAFTASAILTDNDGDQSSSSSCNQTITATGGSAAASPTATPIPIAVADTGPGQTMLFVGALGVIISVVGAILLLAL